MSNTPGFYDFSTRRQVTKVAIGESVVNIMFSHSYNDIILTLVLISPAHSYNGMAELS